MHKKNLNIFCFISDYDEDYIKKLDKNVNIIFRNYTLALNLDKLKKLVSFCKKIDKKIFLANNVRLAQNLKFNGVYIPSFNNKINLDIIKNNNNFTTLGSAHNIKQIKIKEAQGVDIIFIAPVFKVPKSKKYLDITKFNSLAFSTNKKVIALGGLNKSNIKKLNFLRADGFAGISYFKKKRPHKEAV